MRKYVWVLGVAVVLSLPCAYGIHLYRNYEEIQANLKQREAAPARPYVGDLSISEVGYIFEMRRVTHIRDGYFRLIWFIAVPATGKRYSCSYDHGFQGFRTADGVTLIHKKSEADTGTSDDYIIGLHDQQRGNAAAVTAIDVDDLDVF